MFYTVYKITNVINEKIYIGVHKTTDLDDDYMGSGKHLKLAQNKYGIENFEKEYLAIFDNAEDMFNMESKLVNEEFICSELTYNLKLGGYGGWDHITEANYFKRSLDHDWPKIAKENWKIGYNNFLKCLSDAEFHKKYCEARAEGLKAYYENGGKNPFLGKRHSEETKLKIGNISSLHQSGEGNSQFGTIWIHNLEEKLNKKIKQEQFPEYESLGWLKGRKMKF